MHLKFIRGFSLTYGGLWHSRWYEHIPSCWRLFLSTISVPAKKQQQRRILISLVKELWQKNLSRHAEVNPDKNCVCEGVVGLQNKSVDCASRIKKGCVGERSVWGLLHKELYIFLQAVVQVLWTTDKRVHYRNIWCFITKLYIQAHLNFLLLLSNIIQQPKIYLGIRLLWIGILKLYYKTRICTSATSANMLMRP